MYRPRRFAIVAILKSPFLQGQDTRPGSTVIYPDLSGSIGIGIYRIL